jgi:hypothetical protein
MGLLQVRHFVPRPAQSSGADTAIPQDGQLKRIMSDHPLFGDSSFVVLEVRGDLLSPTGERLSTTDEVL